MDRQTVELSALGFEFVLTTLLAIVYYGLWEVQRRPFFLTWATAWGVYALRLGCISAFLVGRDPLWLFAHQLATSFAALLLLWAALQFSIGLRWRRQFLWFPVLATAWAVGAIFGIRDVRTASLTTVVMLAAVTFWTGWVFWWRNREQRSTGAAVLAWTFWLWGLHHLDYPVLRPLGHGVLFGVFADVFLIVVAAIGTLFLVLNQERRALAVRNTQLEQLTRLLLRAQEDERRRIARELHDEAGQILTAVKIELDLDGRKEASEMVARAMTQVRDLSNLLRPTVLDDFGLLPALRGLVEDFGRRTRLEASLDVGEGMKPLAPEQEVVVYRVVQEALTNVARHAQATAVLVQVGAEGREVVIDIEDDGRGFDPAATSKPDGRRPWGLMGIGERAEILGGTARIDSAPGKGARVTVRIPLPRGAEAAAPAAEAAS